MILEGPDFRDGFPFLGGQLALDLVNTRPVLEGEAVELLVDWHAVTRWSAAAGVASAEDLARLRERTPAAEAELFVRDLREFREQLREAVLQWEGRGKQGTEWRALLNDKLLRYPMREQMDAEGNRTRVFEASTAASLFAPIAAAALRLFADHDRSRIRKCVACVLHFYDTSKGGKRRWCSMHLCGNKVKVRAYVKRKRTTQGS